MMQRSLASLVCLSVLPSCMVGSLGDRGAADDAEGGGGGAATSASQASGASVASGNGGGVTTGGSSGGGGAPGACYAEAYHPGVSLADLERGYQPSQWLDTMVAVLDRRYDAGHYLMSAMQSDPWLTGTFPSYFDLGTWEGLMEAVDTACHEETHGYDFEKALGLPGQHLYYMTEDLQIVAPKLGFFSRSEILPLVTAGGSVTSLYDSTYLTGTSGTYDLIFLADELNAYINGLACATTIGEQIAGGHSYRDGAAAHIHYLLAYLRVAREDHPSLYAEWKASAPWQTFVRLSWARARFWTEASMVFPSLGIADAAIWQRIQDDGSTVELELFTGQAADAVACTP